MKAVFALTFTAALFSLVFPSCSNEKQKNIAAAAPEIEKEIKEQLSDSTGTEGTASEAQTAESGATENASEKPQTATAVQPAAGTEKAATPAVSGTNNTGAVKSASAATVATAAAGTAPAGVDPPAFDLHTRTDFPPLTNWNDYLAWMRANTKEEEKFLQQRWERLQVDLSWYPTGTSKRVQQAFLRTPREHFVRDYNLARAYDSWYHVIEDGQTISGPHIVIRMTQTIDPDRDMKVLEIGMGSGYQSAFLSNLSNHVYTIEIKQNLYNVTDKIYKSRVADYPWYANVTRKNADGYYGWPEHAPFDRIIVTCAIDHIPPPLIEQLAPGGIMVIPVGPISGQQTLLKITKEVDADGNVRILREDVYGGKQLVKFVPFTDTSGGWHTEKK